MQVGRETVAQFNGIDGLDRVVLDGPIVHVCVSELPREGRGELVKTLN